MRYSNAPVRQLEIEAQLRQCGMVKDDSSKYSTVPGGRLYENMSKHASPMPAMRLWLWATIKLTCNFAAVNRGVWIAIGSLRQLKRHHTTTIAQTRQLEKKKIKHQP